MNVFVTTVVGDELEHLSYATHTMEQARLQLLDHIQQLSSMECPYGLYEIAESLESELSDPQFFEVILETPERSQYMWRDEIFTIFQLPVLS